MPVIPTVAGWIAETPGTISLGQGVPFFGPPEEATRILDGAVREEGFHGYKPDAGLPPLRRAFEEKLRAENGIRAPFERRILVTAGANQAFLNAVLAIADPGDEIVLLTPYYFNHEMAVALAGCRAVCVPTDRDFQPRLDAIGAAITRRTRAVVTVSPNNPAGVVYPRPTLEAVNRLCADRGIYHISDEAYEYFLYGNARHFSPASAGGDDHTISLFSMSKSYGMAGWRVGFLVAPEGLFEDLMKIQDTVIICAPVLSQAVAREALRIGRKHCAAHLATIATVREAVLSRLPDATDLLEVPPSLGAFYLFVRVRTDMDPLLLTERLVREHRVAVIPGGTFGVTEGCFIRIAYGNLTEGAATEGVERLIAGLRAILRG